LITAAKQLAKAWPTKSLIEQREFLQNGIRRIVVHEAELQVTISQSALRAGLLGQPPTTDGSAHDVFTIIIEASLKRCGWEVRLIVPTGSGAEIPKRPSLPLIKAVARVHRWPEKIMYGELPGRRSIAQLTKASYRYARCVLPLAFLAPDIVEAILDGRQPADLSVQKMLRSLPLSWAEQRKQLGFSVPHSLS
jgi:site-specific DNA recombinase